MHPALRWLSFVPLFLAFAAAVPGQGDGKLTLKASFEPATAKPGDEVVLRLDATVDPAFQAYGSKETTNIPVALDLAKCTLGGLEAVGKPAIPPGTKSVTFGVESFPLPHEFSVTQKFKVPAGAKGEIAVGGEFDYQVCDANMCLPPSTAPFAAKLAIGGAGAQQPAPKPAEPPKTTPPGTKPGLQLVPDEKFVVKAECEPATVQPGGTVKLVLHCTVSEAYHAYGTKETTNIPVSLDGKKLKAGDLQPAGPAQVPPGTRTVVLKVTSYPLPHTFDVVQELRVPVDVKSGDVAIAGELDYQLCTANFCEPPASASFRATVKVAEAAGQPAKQEPAKQEPTKQDAPEVDSRFVVAPRFEPATARAGEAAKLVLQCTVDPRYHAYGTKETTNLPVAIDPAKQKLGALTLRAAQIPPGERAEALGIESFPLPHEFDVVLEVAVPAGAAAGPVAVEGVVDFQICDENMCLPPGEAPFRATLQIEAGASRSGAQAGPETPPQPQAQPRGHAPEPATNAAADDLLGGGILGFLLKCIGGGLFALVMPCTYPMIPITFSFFTKQADARGGRVLTLALAYGLGIVGMFGLIGALASVLGSYIVPFAAHWITNVVIGGAFLLFGLSLLGLFTLQPPAFLVRAAGQGRSVGGLLGVLLMGATLVISSFTCTAPVVGLLLLPAVQSGDKLMPMAGMAVFGLTMALPFVFLALLPGRVKSLPRSGEWMNTLKVTLGVVELAAAMKFFSNAEYVQNLKILPREVFFGIWIVLFVGLGGYLSGLFPRAAVGNGRRVGALASLAFAGYCLYGALGYKLDFVMTALAPAYGLHDDDKEIVTDEAGHPRATDNYAAAVAYAKKNGKLVLVNFTGFTCNNCRMVERGILPADAIAPLLKEHFVEARLHMDNPKVIPADRWTVHEALRQEMVGGKTSTPIYVTIDPTTGKKLVEHVLSGGPTAWEAGYREFLVQSLHAAGRKAPGEK